MDSSCWDTGRFSKLPYLGIKLGRWPNIQSARDFTYTPFLPQGIEIELVSALQATSVKEIKQFLTLITLIRYTIHYLIVIITKINRLLMLMGLCHPGKVRICMQLPYNHSPLGGKTWWEFHTVFGESPTFHFPIGHNVKFQYYLFS